MKEILSILMDDTLTRYSTIVPVSELARQLRKHFDTGLPTNLGHDQNKPLGWTMPLALFFQPGSTSLTGVVFIAETSAEQQHIHSAKLTQMEQWIQEHHASEVAELRSLLSKVMTDKAYAIHGECTALLDTGIAERWAPKLFASADKDGLVSLKELRHLGCGVFQLDDVAFYAHRHFRRSSSYLNNLNSAFFDSLGSLVSQGIEVRLALDKDIVGLARSFRRPFEYEYWWGPRFDESLVRIPPGVTLHMSSESDRLYRGIEQTEFWWQSRDGLHILEAEEINSSGDALNPEYIVCRYVHCIVDEGSGVILHVDGAVREYSREEADLRRAQGIKQVQRSLPYTKLWRVDKSIDIGTWKRLLSDYFRDNHLVGEYLGAPVEGDDLNELNAEDRGTGDDKEFKLVPYSIGCGAGVRISYGYGPLASEAPTPSVVVFDKFGSGEGSYRYIEAPFLDILKLIRRDGNDIYMPSDCAVVKFRDLYVNLPLLRHQSASESAVSPSLDAIRTYLRWAAGRQLDLVMSFALAYPLDGRECRISVFGHCEDILAWMGTSPLSQIPLHESQIEAWCSATAAMNTQLPHTDQPHPFHLLQKSGLLRASRQLVAPEYIQDVSVDNGGVKVILNAESTPSSLIRAFQSGSLSISCALRVARFTCCGCGEDYSQCSCSSVTDGVGKRLEGITAAALFWTDRPS